MWQQVQESLPHSSTAVAAATAAATAARLGSLVKGAKASNTIRPHPGAAMQALRTGGAVKRTRNGVAKATAADLASPVRTLAEQVYFFQILPLYQKGAAIDWLAMASAWNAEAARRARGGSSEPAEDPEGLLHLKMHSHLSEYHQQTVDTLQLRSAIRSMENPPPTSTPEGFVPLDLSSHVAPFSAVSPQP